MSQTPKNKKPVLGMVLGLVALIICAVFLQKSLVFSLLIAVMVFMLTYRWSVSRAQFAKVERTGENKDQPTSDEGVTGDQTKHPSAADTDLALEISGMDEEAAQEPSAVVRLNTLLPGEQELASQKGNWRYTKK